MTSQILKQEFKDFLARNNFSNSSANAYASGIETVCKNENYYWDELIEIIDAKMIAEYDKNGRKEAIGNIGHRTVFNALKQFNLFALTKRHHWTLAENFICCVFYIQNYIIKRKTIHIDDLVKLASVFLPDISPLSIKEKFRNIKQIVLDKGLSDTCSYSKRENASKDNRIAFDDAYNLLK